MLVNELKMSTGFLLKSFRMVWIYNTIVSANFDEQHMIIGGDSIEIEVDKTKLGKRRYNRGRKDDGV